MPDAALSQIIKDKALSLGFNAVGITTPKSKKQDYESLQSYIKNNFHGTMNYLSETAEMRSDILRLFPSAKSVILTLSSYFPHVKTNASSYKISAYSLGMIITILLKKNYRNYFHLFNHKKRMRRDLFFATVRLFLKKFCYGRRIGMDW